MPHTPYPPSPEPRASEFAAAYGAGVNHGTLTSIINRTSPGGTPFVVVAGEVVSLAEYEPAETAPCPTFDDAPSFIAYVNRFKIEEASLIFAQITKTGGSFRAILDYPSTGNEHDDVKVEHVATLSVVPTADWTEWLGVDRKPMSQEFFCDFVERYRHLFVRPKGADMLEIARHIEGKKEGSFAFGKRLQTGDREILWKEETTTTAGRGEPIEIPETVEVTIKPFEGSEPVILSAFLRVRVANGAVAFSFDLIRPSELIRETMNTLRIEIRDETALPVLNGKV